MVSRVSFAVLVLALGAAFFALSPLAGETFPGQIPWRAGSALRWLTEAMSLGHLLESARGVEIKDVALHTAAALALLTAGISFLLRKTELHFDRHARQPWFHAFVLLLLWVAFSFWSASWSGSPDSAIAQATLYAFCLGWAAALAWTLRPPQLAAAETVLIVAATAASVLCAWYYHERNPMHRPGFPLGNPATLSAAILPGAMLALAHVANAVANVVRGRRLDSAHAAAGSAPAGNDRAERHADAKPSVWRPPTQAAAGSDATSRVRAGRMPALPPTLKAAFCAGALLAMAYCIWLASSRSTLIGLLVALSVFAFFRLARRWRWGVVGLLALLLAGAGFWFIALSSRDISMARGATIRYRLYTWRYAAELWQRRPSTGHGAGAYPRLAGDLAALDRALDPGAFLGEIISHAHNEMFEIFAEIGLVGGVTWVGGMVATAYAGLRILRFRRGGPRYWHAVALLAAFIGLLADAMFSAGMRLPGLPTVFWTIVGLIWANARATAREHLEGVADLLDSRDHPRTVRTTFAGAACIVAGLTLGWCGWMNLQGVRAEAESVRAARSHDAARVIEAASQAQALLLDPVRRLLAQDRSTAAHLQNARQATAECLAVQRATSDTPQTESTQACAAAERVVDEVFERAAQLLRITSGWYRSAAYLAHAAELRAQLLRASGDPQAAKWSQRAHGAWQQQRRWLPYDFETLMRLTRYPTTADTYAGLLRDALRSDDLDMREWRARLAEAAATPEFATAVERQLQSAGPLTPASDLDLLVGGMAPETHRLAAAWDAQRQNWPAALAHTDEAVTLYQPMRARFPTLASQALAEHAEYEFASDPARATEAAATLRDALERLPEIQQQQYDDLARPFRESLSNHLLAAGDIEAAREMRALALGADSATNAALAQKLVDLSAVFIRSSPRHRPIIAQWLNRALELQGDHFGAWSWAAWLAAEHGGAAAVEQVLQEAKAAGLTEEQVARIGRSLAEFFAPTSAPRV